MTKLTPTSYALLGLLARQPWSAYELNQRMQYSVLRAFWPRAESHVYSEPKKLLTHKLVRAKKEERNGRLRTVYHITAAGKKALRDWLESETEGYATMQFESMLKFLYADAGDAGMLMKNIDDIEQSAIAEARGIVDGVRAIGGSADGVTTGHGMPYNGLALHFLLDDIEARIAWTQRARMTLGSLTETGNCPQTMELGANCYRELMTRLDNLLD